MKFALRVDDLGWIPTDPKEPDRGLRLTRQFHAAMQGLPYLGGVIPGVLDLDGLTWLQSRPEGLTIAIHGWDHQKVDGVESECRNKSLAECRGMIAAGRILLIGNNGAVPHFVPPWNAVEPDLPEACHLEGVRYIWGAPSDWPTPPQPHPMGRVTFVPSWRPTYAATLWRMSAETPPLSETLPELLCQPGRAVICLHLTWEAVKCDDFRGVRWLVDLIRERVITPEEFLK
jgi:hypothetical protein